MNNRKKIWVGGEFLKLKNTLKTNLSSIYGRRVSDSELTNNLGSFFFDEGLDKIILRRANYRKKSRNRGGLF